MPFDGIDIYTMPGQSVRTLRSAIVHLGVTPVPAAVLKNHKVTEVAKHQGSLFWRHESLYHWLTLTFMLLSFVSVITTPLVGWVSLSQNTNSDGIHMPLISTALLVCSWAFLIKLVVYTKAIGPAKWVENHARRSVRGNGMIHNDFTSVPEPITLIARQIERMAPNTVFVIGTLYQEKIALDPYLTAYEIDEYGVKRSFCLGVWDDNKIIHIATMA